jgi:hypothetical protein
MGYKRSDNYTNQPRELDPKLLDFATERQAAHIQSVIEHGSIHAASRETGFNRATIQNAINTCRTNAIRRGYSPENDMVHTAPEGFSVVGTTTLHHGDKGQVMQWVRTKVDSEKQGELAKEFAKALADEVRGLAKPVKKPVTNLNKLVTLYPMGDPHFGLFAWGEECGEDYNLKIAAKENKIANERISEASPDTKVAIILNVGDFFHADNQQKKTNRSGAILDVDGRIQKVVRVGTQSIKYKIDLALAKHQKVYVRNDMGNHDEILSQMLSLILNAYYEKEKRVVIDTSPNHYWYYEFGKNLFGSTHGDTVKMEALGEIMAEDQPEAWGRTHFRYWFTGHIHHKKVQEFRGCQVESFNTLAARDAWHTKSGYRSKRNMQSIVFHKDYGEQERHTISIEEIQKS